MVRPETRHWIARTLLLVSAASPLLLTGCGGGGSSLSSPPPASLTVSINPANVVLAPGGTQQFTATVTGGMNTSVSWQVNGVTGGSSALGTISSSGWYTAPSTIPASDPLTVSAVSQADTTQSASAAVKVALPVLSSISPSVVTAGSPGLTLTANGSLFTKASQVMLNGSAQPTTFVSESQLAATISATDIANTSPPSGFPVAVQTGGITTNSLELSVVARSAGPTSFSVVAGGITNLGVVPLTPTPANTPAPLLLWAVGAGNVAGSGGTGLQRGSSATLLLAGDGIVPGTSYEITGPDVSVTQPSAADFQTCTTGGTGSGTSGTPCVKIGVSVGATAAPGPRNIIVTNQAGELTSFVGGLLITQ